MIFLYLSSALFLGWSLGANDASNVFGTAVGTRMIRFRTAIIICALFVLLGAAIGGTGTSETLNELGKVNSLGAAFVVCLTAGLSVFVMTRYNLPVSTSQAIVGGIIGWNFYTGHSTSETTLYTMVSSWVLSPVLAAVFAIGLYFIYNQLMKKLRLHLLWRDFYIRSGLLLAGIFGSYSLGANNVANVIGVFIHSSPFTDFTVYNITITGLQQLYLLGGAAIATGVLTYSKKVMMTVGKSLYKLSSEMALIAVLAQAMVLFIFSSKWLEALLINNHLPAIPLVPVSSTQAVVGAVLGLGIIKNARGLKYRVLGEISLGWIITPVIAGVLAFISLFVLENVFNHPLAG